MQIQASCDNSLLLCAYLAPVLFYRALNRDMAQSVWRRRWWWWLEACYYAKLTEKKKENVALSAH